MIHLPSSDPDGVIGQFYSAAAASAKGMSVLSVDNIIRGAPRVLVMTLTMWTKDPKGRLKPSKTRTYSVFRLNPIAVCFVVCNYKDGCDDELRFWCVNTQGPTMLVATTSLTAIRNIIRVTQRDPLPCPLFDDIITEEHFYDLIMGRFLSDDDRNMRHFGLTPIDEIEPG